MKNLFFVFLIFLFSLSLNAEGCFKASILKPSPFMGNNGEIFELSDGSLWEIENEYEYLYEYYPSVVVCPSRGKLIIKKKSLDIKLVSAARNPKQSDSNSTIPDQSSFKKSGDWVVFEKTNLKGTISGTVKKGKILETTSGNIYEVTGLSLQLVLELQPKVIVFQKGDTYKLIVEGFKEPLICSCLSCSSNDSGALSKKETSTQGKTVIESTIVSDFNGFEYGNIYKLANGQIWQQTESWIWVWVWVNPSVLIWNDGGIFKMKVDQIDHAVTVERKK